MKKTLLILFVIFSIVPSFSQAAVEKNILQQMRSISSQELLDYVKIMCDEKYAGRLTGTKEYLDCAEWLAGEFSKWLIVPLH